MENEDIVEMAMDPVGSHIVTSFMNCKINLGKKNKIFKKMKTFYVKLACDKFGSRSFDSLWLAADLKQKEKIALELLDKEAQITNNLYGKIMVRNCNLENFKLKREQWADRIKANKKKQDMFADIIDATTTTTTTTTTTKAKAKEGIKGALATHTNTVVPIGYVADEGDNDADKKSKKSKKDGKKSKKDKKEKKNKKNNDDIEGEVDPRSLSKNEIDDLFVVSKGKQQKNVKTVTVIDAKNDNNNTTGGDLGGLTDFIVNSKSKKSKKNKRTSDESKIDGEISSAKKVKKFMR